MMTGVDKVSSPGVKSRPARIGCPNAVKYFGAITFHITSNSGLAGGSGFPASINLRPT